MKVNKYQWHDEVEKAFTNKLLTISTISEISKHLYELAQKTDDSTKKTLIKKQLKYKELYTIDNETQKRTFFRAYLQLNGNDIGTDFYKLYV